MCSPRKERVEDSAKGSSVGIACGPPCFQGWVLSHYILLARKSGKPSTTRSPCFCQIHGLFAGEELNRLPEKYRAPFVLCCLEGKSRAEAARPRGWATAE